MYFTSSLPSILCLLLPITKILVCPIFYFFYVCLHSSSPESSFQPAFRWTHPARRGNSWRSATSWLTSSSSGGRSSATRSRRGRWGGGGGGVSGRKASAALCMFQPWVNIGLHIGCVSIPCLHPSKCASSVFEGQISKDATTSVFPVIDWDILAFTWLLYCRRPDITTWPLANLTNFAISLKYL